jgi:hypothetical protein
MKKKSGIIENQTFLNEIVVELPKGKLITLNQYSLQISGELSGLLYKRDKNLPQDIVGKKISYLVTKDGLIYNSKILKK